MSSFIFIEDREELYKWIITFNILKIKAFYDNYSKNFGFVNFPLYKRNKNEKSIFSFKLKKITKFNYALYKDIYLNTNEEKINKKKKNDNKSFLYNNFFLRDENGKKEEYNIKIISLAQEMLIKFKYLVKYSLPIYLSNIQLSLIKNPHEFNKSNSNLNYEIELKTPNYIESHKDENLKNEIMSINERVSNNNKIKNENIEKFTPQEKRYLSQFYPNYNYQKENNNKIILKVKDIKKYIEKKHIEKTRYKLFETENNKINIKSEWKKYLISDKNYFMNFQEEKIDTSDNLRYTDYIERYDINGNLKEKSNTLYRKSIIPRIKSDSIKINENPILGNLISRHNDSFNNELEKVSDTEEDKENDDNLEKNDNLNNDEYDEKNKESNPNNKIDMKEENNDNKEIIEENKESEKKDKTYNTKDTKKSRKSKKSRAKDKSSEDTLERKERLKKINKDKKESNLIELISDNNKDINENSSRKKGNKLNKNTFDLAKEIKKSYITSKKKINKNILNSESSQEKSLKKNDTQIKVREGSLNSFFSFGESKNNVFDLNQKTKNNQNLESNSNKYQDSSMMKSSKSENESSRSVKKNKSNEDESITDEKEKKSNNENDSLSIQNKLFEELNKKGKENEVKISFNSNNKNITSNNTEKLSENYENNKINENKNNDISKNSMKNNSKHNSNMKYNYLNDLSPNRKFIINIKLKEKHKNEKNTNPNSSESDAFEKLRDINISLDNEKSLSSYFKIISKENTVKNLLNNNSRNRNNSSKYTQDITIHSTNSNCDSFFYPNVYYINDKSNLHTKNHVSMLFSNLKTQNNIYNQEKNN